jgi:hypothetical protein
MKSIKCPICGELFTSEQEFRKHFNSHVDNIIESAEDDFDKELVVKEMEDIADRFEALINEIDEFNRQNKAYGYGFDINIDKNSDDANRITFTLIQSEEDECDLDCDDCEEVCDSFGNTFHPFHPFRLGGKRATIGAVDDAADLTEEEKNNFESFLESFLHDLPKSKKVTVDNVDISDAVEYFTHDNIISKIDMSEFISHPEFYFIKIRKSLLEYAKTKGLEIDDIDDEETLLKRIIEKFDK